MTTDAITKIVDYLNKVEMLDNPYPPQVYELHPIWVVFDAAKKNAETDAVVQAELKRQGLMIVKVGSDSDELDFFYSLAASTRPEVPVMVALGVKEYIAPNTDPLRVRRPNRRAFTEVTCEYKVSGCFALFYATQGKFVNISLSAGDTGRYGENALTSLLNDVTELHKAVGQVAAMNEIADATE